MAEVTAKPSESTLLSTLSTYLLYHNVVNKIGSKEATLEQKIRSYVMNVINPLLCGIAVTIGTLYLTGVVDSTIMLPSAIALSGVLIPYTMYRSNGEKVHALLVASALLVGLVYGNVLSPAAAAPVLVLAPGLKLLSIGGFHLKTELQMRFTGRDGVLERKILANAILTVMYGALAALLLFSNSLSISIATPICLGIMTLAALRMTYLEGIDGHITLSSWVFHAALCTLIYFNQIPPPFLVGMTVASFTGTLVQTVKQGFELIQLDKKEKA